MKFADLKFDNVGCCDQHGAWAIVQHENGLRTEVHCNDGGTHRVVTFAGNVLIVGAQECATEAEVEGRLAADSAR
jgi:hypothetical protein